MASFLIGEFLGTAVPQVAKSSDISITGGGRFSYVTLITDDSFFQGVCALSKTIKKYNKHPLCAMVTTSGISPTTLKRLEEVVDRVVVVPEIKNPFQGVESMGLNKDNGGEGESVGDGGGDKDRPSWFGSEFTKLNLWGLTDFDKVVYIDADAIVLQCTDELFDLDTSFAAAPDVFPPDKFNAGVLVIKPDVAILECMLQCISDKRLSSYDGGDTGFLNAYFPHWYSSSSESRLPFKYNAQRTMYWFTHEKRPGYWESIGPLKIIHYSSSPKPWQESPPPPSSGKQVEGKKLLRLGDLEWLWWQHYLGID